MNILLEKELKAYFDQINFMDNTIPVDNYSLNIIDIIISNNEVIDISDDDLYPLFKSKNKKLTNTDLVFFCGSTGNIRKCINKIIMSEYYMLLKHPDYRCFLSKITKLIKIYK